MFIQSEYNENDARAKNKLIELFSETPRYNRCVLNEPLNPYTVDFYVNDSNGKHIANIEVEVKNAWRTFDFTYSDIQLLPRKKKFWVDPTHHLNKPTMFVMFNRDLSNHLVIMSDVMQQIYFGSASRSYGTEKTRNDDFFVAKKSQVLFSYFGSKKAST